MVTPGAISVSQLNMFVKSLLEGEPALRAVLVKGEISNYTRNAKSGHAYFSLKDGQAAVKAVMFNMSASKLSFNPKDGMSVFVVGRVSVYERDGAYQLYVDKMVPDGMGEEYAAFLKLKQKLEDEGFFNPEFKKPIPGYPEKIGVITSETGAAVQDFCSIVGRRYPCSEIIIYGCIVQGAECAESVIKGIKYFNRYKPDVIVVTRGGGSYEDLSGFNDESLAREVFKSEVPVVSAIGHETDYTIIDFVSDLRAPTPSAAAELVTPNKSDLLLRLASLKLSAENSVNLRLLEEKVLIDSFTQSTNLEAVLGEKTENLDYMMEKIRFNAKHILQKYSLQLDGMVSRINALNPLAVLSRGYSLTYSNDKLIKSVAEVKKDDKIKIIISDGEINCYVE